MTLVEVPLGLLLFSASAFGFLVGFIVGGVLAANSAKEQDTP